MNATIQSVWLQRMCVSMCECFRAAAANLISVKSEHNPCVRPFIRNYLYGCQFSHIGMPCFRNFFFCIESVLYAYLFVPNGNGRWSLNLPIQISYFHKKKVIHWIDNPTFFFSSHVGLLFWFLVAFISEELCEMKKQLGLCNAVRWS